MKSQQRKLIIFFFSALTLLLASHLFNNGKWFHPSLQKQAERFQEKLAEKETILEQKLDALVKSTELTGVYNTSAAADSKDLFTGEGMLFFIYEDDELKFWSNNSVQALDELTPRRNYEAPLQKLSNGWYLSKIQQAGNKTYAGLLLIKNEYPFENKYLQNSFNPCLGMDDGFEIGIEQAQEHSGTNEHSTKTSSYQATVKSKNGTALFTLVKANEKPHVDFHQAASIILFFAGLSLLLFFFYGIFKNSTISKLILFPAVVLLIRAAMLYFHYPPSLYSLPLFDPAYHGSSEVFPSLGDFLFNILTVTLLIFYLSRKIRFNVIASDSEAISIWGLLRVKNPRNDGIFKKESAAKTGLAIAFGAVLLLSVMCLHFPVRYLMERLILDSDIDFTINNLFTLTLFSYAGLFITWLLLLAWYFVFNRIVEGFPGKGIKEKLFS